jgi:Zn-dependent peptidase ImmA (M78 family)/transcriptional regulator with XRE-family HTH domain
MNPQIFRWARETAGLSLEQGATAIGLNDAYGKRAAERLAEIEAGANQPSPSQLSRMAKAYRRSLLVFYLSSPPRTGDRGQDFRRVRDSQRLPYDANLDALLRDVKSRQDLVRSVLEDLESEPVTFVGSADISMPVAFLARTITNTIGFSLVDFRAAKSADHAFAYLRSRIEANGVFVLLIGDLGSYHSKVSPDVFRGFAIADKRAPFAIVNDQDAPAARSFTVVHELAHIWLGESGISGGTATTNRIEQYCNDVAAEVLLPSPDFNPPALNTLDEMLTYVSTEAQKFNLSRAMIAYRLFRRGTIVAAEYHGLAERLREQWLEYKARTAAKQRESETGPSYYVVRRNRLGPALLDLMRRSLSEGAITYTKAGRVLGVKPTNVGPLLRSDGSA